MLKHVPGTRAPLAGQHQWHALVEGTTVDPAVNIAAELEGLLAALQHGISATRYSPQMRRRPRPSGSCATPFPKPSAPRVQRWRTISRSRSPTCRRSSPTPRQGRSGLSRRRCQRIRASGRWQHPLSCPRRQPRRAGLVRRRGREDHKDGRRSRHRRGRVDLRRARHRTAEAAMSRRTRAARPNSRAARDQGGARPVGDYEPGEINS